MADYVLINPLWGLFAFGLVVMAVGIIWFIVVWRRGY
jgi:hypothetical protein